MRIVAAHEVPPDRDRVVERGRIRMVGRHPVIDREHRGARVVCHEHRLAQRGKSAEERVRSAVHVHEQPPVQRRIRVRGRHPIDGHAPDLLAYDPGGIGPQQRFDRCCFPGIDFCDRVFDGIATRR